MRQYLLYSTIVAIFSAGAVVQSAIDIRLVYFIVIVNLPLFLFLWNFSLPRYYLLFLAYIWTSGALEVAFGPDILSKYLMEAVGITALSLYFYLFFKSQHRSVIDLFDLYARASFWVCVFGLILSLIESLVTHRFVPVKSVLDEPAHFAAIVLPSFYYYASNGPTLRRSRLRGFAILLAILLSFSSVGMLGLLLSIALLFRNRSKALLLFLAPVLIGLLFWGAYLGSAHFRIRVDDTVQSVSKGNVGNANLSTYALVSNAYVAIRAFQERPLFGYGLGGHIIAHEKYVWDLPGAAAMGDMMNLNAADANSLLLRTLSEFGLTGIILLFLFLIKFWASGSSVYAKINAGAFVYLCMKLLREGHWFSPEMYFFVWVYIFTWSGAHRERVTARADLVQSTAVLANQT